MDVPVCTYTWRDDPGAVRNIITPFTEEKLKALYATHEDYVRKVVLATMNMVERGFLLPEDGATIILEGMEARIPE